MNDCMNCGGDGYVVGFAPNRQSRFVSHDDLNPDDYSVPCPLCEGTGQAFEETDQ